MAFRSPFSPSGRLTAAGARAAAPRRAARLPPLAAQRRDDGAPSQDTGVGLKAVWFGAEAFGNLVGLAKRLQGGPPARQQQQERGDGGGAGAPAALPREQALAALRRDYDANYFISGQGDLSAYEPDCEFADPFAAFRGVARFKRNVGNLGALLSDVELELLEWREERDALVTRWRFAGVLGLPWRPRLAAAGGTTHVFDPRTGRVARHVESWDVDPGRVVASLLRPSARVPTSAAEVLMHAVADGDGAGVWRALSGGALKLSAAGVGVCVLAGVAGAGVPAPVTPVLAGVAAAAAATEVLKFSEGMQGSKGTGGRF